MSELPSVGKDLSGMRVHEIDYRNPITILKKSYTDIFEKNNLEILSVNEKLDFIIEIIHKFLLGNTKILDDTPIQEDMLNKTLKSFNKSIFVDDINYFIMNFKNSLSTEILETFIQDNYFYFY